MAWEDRQYYRDRSGDVRNPFFFLLFGSIPLFPAFGIRVRAHMGLVLLIPLVILYNAAKGGAASAQIATEAMAILFVIVLLHEFGHCFASRWVGGNPEQIIMTPLGGAAFVDAPHRPGATFIAVAGGPAVNIVICLVTAILMFGFYGFIPWNPIAYAIHHGLPHGVLSYLWWIYSISLALLLFNLLPIFPLDGGQLLQSLLWFKFGYYKATMFACITGIIGGLLLAVLGLYWGSVLLIFIALSGVVTCVSLRRQLREAGPESEYGGDAMDYSASLRPDPITKKRRRVSKWTIRRLRREAARDAAEQQAIDTILAKVSAQGMQTLTWSERRALKRATDRQRKRDLELSRRD